MWTGGDREIESINDGQIVPATVTEYLALYAEILSGSKQEIA